MSFFQEFKNFAMRGNVVDFAVGIVIGAAFGKIINSLVNDILMPPLGLLINGVDFNQLSWVIQPATNSHPEVVIKYGLFIGAILDFILIALAIFILIKFINRVRREAPATKACPQCLLLVPIGAKRCGHCAELIGL